MTSSLNKLKVFKNGGLKEKSLDSIVIGGADLSDLADKQSLIDQKIEEALEKTRNESERILQDARKEAEKIIEIAEAKKEVVEAEATILGIEQGREKGHIEIRNELRGVLEDSQKILESIEKERKEVLEDEEERIYKIICLIAKKLLKRDLAVNKEIAINLIESGIKLLSHKSTVNILVDPKTADELTSLRDQILQRNPGIENLTITASTSLQHGDLVLESNKDRLDLRLDAQLDELLESITEQ